MDYCVNVRHILIQAEDASNAESMAAAKTQAEELYAQWQADPTEDNFINMAGTYTQDPGSQSTGGLYEDIYPGQTVTIKDAAPYGIICLQGYGTFGEYPLETPTLIRYGELTNDEFFVSEKKAKAGVTITNTSSCEPIVILKHFAENPELDRFMKG